MRLLSSTEVFPVMFPGSLVVSSVAIPKSGSTYFFSISLLLCVYDSLVNPTRPLTVCLPNVLL